jgi:hypothetical protein
VELVADRQEFSDVIRDAIDEWGAWCDICRHGRAGSSAGTVTSAGPSTNTHLGGYCHWYPAGTDRFGWCGQCKKKPEKTAISWVDAEWISLDDHLKQTYGLTGPRNAAPGFACRQNIREVMYPGFFHGCEILCEAQRTWLTLQMPRWRHARRARRPSRHGSPTRRSCRPSTSRSKDTLITSHTATLAKHSAVMM